ncbi:MAG: hypothetical protein WCD79_00465 [Chthoniobacteraceae bacterium]
MENHESRLQPDENSRNGSALVIVLAFLVLLTVLTVAFFSRAATERQVSNSSVNQTSAELFARSATEIIVGDLKQEIVAGSSLYTFTGAAGVTNIYTPMAATGTPPVITNSVVPWVSGAPLPVASGSAWPIPNLIRRSVRPTGDPTYVQYPTYYVAPPPNRAAPINSSSDASQNGRSVSLGRWNLHYLMPTGANTDSTPVNFTAPDWVLVTRSGSNPTAWSSSITSSGTNPVIGRYAYAIYDEGGLLDANVAGCPSGVTSTGTLSGARGFAAFADLTAAGLTAPQIDNLVGWRNYATTQPSGSLSGSYNFNAASGINYYNYILGGTSGFLTTNHNTYAASGTAGLFTSGTMAFTGSPARTDQVFPNRQALIKFWNANGFSTSSLQYFGTFTRDLNAPNFTPLTNPPIAATLTPAQLTYSGATSGTNPIVQNVLYTNTAATNCGQPVVSQRFPLSRLALFANPTANAAAIQTYFGLTQTKGTVKDSYTWNYNPTLAATSANTLNTLAQVGALAPTSGTTRPPNFFEILQAAVLQGSIACYTGYVGSPNPLQVNFTPDIIMQMGVNLIDQYNASAYPTVISFNSQTFAGIKNLPYLSEVLFWPYRPTSDTTGYTLNGYGLIELWNPHQNASDVSSTPQKLMVTIGTGGASTYVAVTGTYVIASPGHAVGSAAAAVNLVSLLTGSDSATFSNSTTFQEPTVLGTPGDNDNATGADWFTVVQTGSVTQAGTPTITGTRSGFLLGSGSSMPDHNLAVAMGDPFAPNYPIEWNGAGWSSGGSRPPILLSFQDASGNWHPYQGNNVTTNTNFMSLQVGQGEIKSAVNANSPFPPNNTPVTNDIGFSTFNYICSKSMQLSDPRTQNGSGFFSGFSTYGYSARPFLTTGTMGCGTSTGRYFLAYYQSYSMPYNPNTDSNTPYGSYPGMLNENGTNSIYVSTYGSIRNTYIADLDGVIRPGDGVYGDNPLPAGSGSARPILLERPFRSVGEMGYADRGYGAWKNINFFSQESGDAGLLDFFSIDQAPVAAGKINLNTRQAPVLQAILQGAYRMEPLGTATIDTLTSSDASNLATAIVAHTSGTSGVPSYIAGPLVSRADLVRGLLGDPAITTVIAGIHGSATPTTDPTNTNKARREAFVRALADVGTTRTWNLLIDVVAQTGNYPSNAGNLSQFLVQGEKHYWLHVALDRYTGEIIDEQWELVNE